MYQTLQIEKRVKHLAWTPQRGRCLTLWWQPILCTPGICLERPQAENVQLSWERPTVPRTAAELTLHWPSAHLCLPVHLLDLILCFTSVTSTVSHLAWVAQPNREVWLDSAASDQCLQLGSLIPYLTTLSDSLCIWPLWNLLNYVRFNPL